MSVVKCTLIAAVVMLAIQCAAVKTNSSLRRVPPQMSNEIFSGVHDSRKT